MRKSFFPMLWIGIAAAVLSGRQDFLSGASSVAEVYGRFETNADFMRALFSPLAPLILAFVIRVAVSFLAFALAYPLTRWAQSADYSWSRRSSRIRRAWVDRLNLTRAYRSLRWTWAVREVAAQRAGNMGRRLARLELLLGWANPLLFVAMILAVSSSSPA